MNKPQMAAMGLSPATPEAAAGVAPGPAFFVCDIFDASPKDDLGTMEHPIFSLSTRPDRRILSYEHNGTTVEVTPSVKGRATIHDKDILIYCISQLMAAVNAGREISRTLHLKAHDLLQATGRDTSGDGYARLREAFERLAGTRITTNLATGGVELTKGFGLIESWEIKRRVQAGRGQSGRGQGRMLSVVVTLSEWLFRAVQSKSVLTLNRAYFTLRKPLERRVYELARKHCGRQPDWQISVATLHKKAGSSAPLRVFRAALRKMIAADSLPDYHLAELPGDLLQVTRRSGGAGALIEGNGSGGTNGPGGDPLDLPVLRADTLEAARGLKPGADVYALEAEWRGVWVASGRPKLGNADRAFLGWLQKQG